MRRVRERLRKEDQPFLREPRHRRNADDQCSDDQQPFHDATSFRAGRGHRGIIGRILGYTPRMIELTSKQRRELRAKAHALHPVVSVGQHGLTAQVMREVDVALKAHALVKVRVFSEDRAEREAMLGRIAAELDAAPVQHLGKLLIVWRPVEEKKPEVKPAKRAAKTVKRTLKKTPAREPRAKTGFDDNGRTSRSARVSFGRSAPNPRRRRRAS